jgi:hypothetical protein
MTKNEQMEQVQERLLELLHYQKNRLAYRKRCAFGGHALVRWRAIA